MPVYLLFASSVLSKPPLPTFIAKDRLVPCYESSTRVDVSLKSTGNWAGLDRVKEFYEIIIQMARGHMREGRSRSSKFPTRFINNGSQSGQTKGTADKRCCEPTNKLNNETPSSTTAGG